MEREVVGGVEHVVVEARGEVRELFLDVLELRLLRRGQFGAAQTEVAQLVVDEPAPRIVELRERCRGGEVLVSRIEPLVLREVGIERGELGQVRVIGRAQRRRAHDGVEMTHRAPGAIDPVEDVVERIHHRGEGRRARIGRDRFECGAGAREEIVDRRRNVVRADRIEARQTGKIEQRIQGRVGVHRGCIFVVVAEDRACSIASSAARSAGLPTFAHGPV